MLETVLTRIILRYAQRYICDTLRTDSLSLWGGDLRVQNFELRSEELSRALGTADSLRLTRGFVRELRVVVPWNAIRSQSLRVEVDAVEIIFCSEGRGSEPEPVPLPSKETSQESLEETQETWLQPLLRNIFGNIIVSVDNLVTKLVRNGAVACVTVERLDSRPQSPQWEACFTTLTSQPTLFRVVSIRDATMTLDAERGRRRRAKAARGRQVALPIIHRVSAEIFIEWPLLPWSTPADSPPTSRLGLHLSPIRARLAREQVQCLALMAGLSRPALESLPEEDSESDHLSMLSAGGSSRTLGEKPSVSRQGTPAQLGDYSPRGERPPSCPATPSKGTPPKLPSEHEMAETPGRGLGGFLADLFGDDEEEEEPDEEEQEHEGARALRETRRIVTFAACVPIFTLSLEKGASDAAGPPWHAGHTETCWRSTLSLIGLSATALSPADAQEPFEGSVELQHVSLQLPEGFGLSWGTALAQDPMEAEEVSSPAPTSSSPAAGTLPAGRSSSKVTNSSLSRAVTWIQAGRRLVGDFPPASHDVLGISGSLVARKDSITEMGVAAVRLGFLIVATENKDSEAEAQAAPSFWRFSVHLAAPSWRSDLANLVALQEMFQPLLRSPPPAPATDAPAPATPATPATPTPESASICQATLCCSGLTVDLSGFQLHLGPMRAELREKATDLDEAYLASLLRETTVFISSSLPPRPLAQDVALAQLVVSSMALRGAGADEEVELMSVKGCSMSTFTDVESSHLEVRLEHLALCLMEAPLARLATVLREGGSGVEGDLEGSQAAFHLQVEDLEVGVHLVESDAHAETCSTPRPSVTSTPPWATSETEDDEALDVAEATPLASSRVSKVQFLLLLRELQLSYQEDVDTTVLGGCRLDRAAAEVEERLCKMTEKASPTLRAWSRSLPEAALLIACQLVPAALPMSFPPTVWISLQHIAEVLPSRGNALIAYLAPHHVCLSAKSLSLAMRLISLQAAAGESASASSASSASPEPGSSQGELGASAALLTCEIMVMPCSVYLLRERALACFTLPLVLATDPMIQVLGTRFNVYPEGVDMDPVGEVRRSLTDEDVEGEDQVVVLRRGLLQLWRAETPSGGERPTVTLDVNLTVTPLKIKMNAMHLRALQEWAADIESSPVAEVPAPSADVKGSLSRVRLALSLRSTVSLELTLTSEAAALKFQLPSCSITCRQMEDHFSARLRMARPELHMEDTGPLSHQEAVVEWCEDSEERKRSWLRANLTQRGGQPLRVYCASLNMALRARLSPILGFVTCFAQESRPRRAPARKVSKTSQGPADPREMILEIKSITLTIPGEEEELSFVSVGDLSCTTSAAGLELGCQQLSATLLGRHHVNATTCSVLLADETQVSVETLSLQLLTAKLFPDLQSCWPQVKSDTSEEKEESEGSTTRLRLGIIDLTLKPDANRHLDLKCVEAFVHLPASAPRRICFFGVEALSMVAHNATMAMPLLSPMQLNGSLATLGARSELRLSGSPMRVTAGAWQLSLIMDVCSFRDPDEEAQPEPVDARPQEPEETMERLLLELQQGDSQAIPDEALPLRWSGACPYRLTVLNQSWEQMDPWQAVKVVEAPGSYVLRLSGPARISDVYVQNGKVRCRRVLPEDYEVAAWDDALGQFVTVRGDGPLDEFGEAMMERMAQSSHLLRLSFRQSLQQNFLVELEAMASAAELAVTMTTPRLTWSVCNSGVFLPPRSAPRLEEIFGDISFLGVHLGVWQGQGMAIGARAQSVGADFYDMSSLSLVPIVVPEENSIQFAMRTPHVERPEHVALRTEYERRNTIDLDLGHWRMATLPWAMARVVDMGCSLSRVGTDIEICESLRQPVLLRNGLPVQLVFCQPGAEVYALPSGGRLGYAWYFEKRQLCFGRDKDTLSEPLRLEVEKGVRWASLELPSLWKLCVCIRRTSCAQVELELLPPVLLRSELSYPLEFRFFQRGMSPSIEPDEEKSPSARCLADCGGNGILDEMRFAKDLPVGQAMRTPSDVGEREEFLLKPGQLVGFQAPGRLQFRRDSDWSVELPVSHDLPFTTMMTLEGQAGAETVLCTGQDLSLGLRQEKSPEQPAAPGSAMAMPQIVWLRPLMTFTNSTKWCLNLLAPPLHLAADPWTRSSSHGRADPRQLRHLEIQVPESKEGLMFSSGPLLLSSLTQFSSVEADELVSWRNAVRCSRGEGMAYAELHLLLEIRRCRQSGLLREVIAEPMWQVRNETGCEILFGLPRGEPCMPLAEQGHVILHRAESGESWTAALGAVQHDPSFPLSVCLGVAQGATVLWTAATCPVGQSTFVEVSEEKCFRLLVSVDVRKRGDSASGGILVSLFAGSYLSNELALPVVLQFQEAGEISLAAKAALEPCPGAGFGPLEEAAEESGEVTPLALGIKVQGGTWTQLRMVAKASEARSGTSTAKDCPPLRTMQDLLSLEPSCSGEVLDQTLELPTGERASCIFNLAFRVQGGVLMVTLLPSQAPWVCSNLSCRTLWLSEAWIRPGQIQRWHRMASGSCRDLECSFLRSLEVFPNAEMSPRESREAVKARISLDPEAESEDGQWHLDVMLGSDNDRYWQPPLPRGLEPDAVPSLRVCVRCAAGVTLLEIRDDEPVPEVTILPKSGEALKPSLDVRIQVRDLVLNASRGLVVHAKNLGFGFRKEVEEEAQGRRPTTRQLYHFQCSMLSVGESQVGRLQQVLFVPPISAEACLLHPPFASAAWELIRVQLADQEDGDALRDSCWKVYLEDGLLELIQALANDFGEEFSIGAEPSTQPPNEDFNYISLGEVYLPALPILADLRLTAPVYVSFTALSLTFPEIRLANVTTTHTKLGQELIAHCIAFLLLNSPVLLGSCDLFGNPVQAYRHLRSGLSDLLHRPLREGVGSLARHTASASLLSLAGLCDSLRQNLPRVPSGPSGANASTGLGAGVKAFADGLGRGLSGMIRWEQHTPLPERSGTFGALRGARNAVAGAVAHPVGGFLDFMTAASRTWSEASAFQGHSPECQACLGFWPLRPTPDVSPAKYYQCSEAVAAILFWTRCELVCLDGEAQLAEPNLRLLPAGVLVTSEQLLLLLEGATHVLKKVKAVEAETSGVITVSSEGIWQLRVRDESERGELLKLLRACRESVQP